ncbi:TPA: aminopeptidase [Bacillus cereus]|uniref:aminopeptidase n=1 Tax=unclassified Bacillus (in: firmicutes) TaxID=185979 RepID=UPI0012620FEA|nr:MULTISPECIES: aminopeptidase [unclassified Bacillus (in: firmicutes)]MCX2701578.1 aminopeptidase [Bacillus sp. AS_5]HDR4863952.1 aminopeptidase [Bacillus cereus]KAB7681924.1 aminopeptidase [Bacillus sp. B1-WWTP-T-0.5-Post-4]MCW4653949.1 aminopeptidase [Bacillus sp. AS_3]HDR4877055.1 aminopeptidase [Bacillus cereus]
MTFEEKLQAYAELTVKIGVNIQPGQYLLVNTSVVALDFARIVVKEAYKAGAARVHVNFSDEEMERAYFDYASDEEFNRFPEWIVKMNDELLERKGALLMIDAADPDKFTGISSDRLATYQKVAGAALRNNRNAVMKDSIAWSMVAVPSPKWASKVFPDLATEDQVPALWEAIFKAVRIGEGSAIEKWCEHVTNLESRAVLLNNKKYMKLHYTAPGTDLTIALAPQHKWVTGGGKTPDDTIFMANMPTEEVYTLPMKQGVNGYVSNTKPLVYQGNIIDGFKLTFEEGKIVKAEAQVGHDLLQELINVDEGSCYLGEVALVPHESPISASGILYFNTLFDENASNHLAIGKAYPTCLEDGRDLENDQLETLGANISVTHEDFMIGSSEMDIDGILPDGTVEPIFRKGSWAF